MLWRRLPVESVLTCAVLIPGLLYAIAFFGMAYLPALHPLPYPGSASLFSYIELSSKGSGVSLRDLDELRHRVTAASSFAAYRYRRSSLLGAQGLDEVRTAEVSGDFLQTLSLSPVLGSAFQKDNFAVGSGREVLIGGRFWKSRFGQSPGVIGTTVSLGGKPVRIAGVIDAGSLFAGVDVWVPIVEPQDAKFVDDRSYGAIGRLKPGASLAAAQSQAEAALRDLESEFPNSNRGWRPKIAGLEDEVAGPARNSNKMLAAACLALYFLSLANAAAHVLGRTIEGERETAVRMVLGQTGWLELTRRLLRSTIESAIATVVAFSAYLALHKWLLMRLPEAFSQIDQSLHFGKLLGFSACLCLLAAGFVSVLPLLRLMQFNPFAVLQGRAGQAAVKGGALWNSILIALQTGSTVVLLILAGLLGKSAWKIDHQSLGFDPDGVVLAQISTNAERDPSPATAGAAYAEALERLSADSRFIAAGASSDYPLGGADTHVVSCSLSSVDQCEDSIYASVSANYLRALGVRTKEGRLFSASDDASSNPAAVISASAAERFFPQGAAVGNPISIAGETMTVVGVVPDVARVGVLGYQSRGGIQTYALHRGAYSRLSSPRVIAVRSGMPPAETARAVQEDLAEILPGMRVARTRALTDLLDSVGLPSRRYASLLTLCVLFAAVITLAGVFSVSFLAIQGQRKAAGIRFAFGAPRGRVMAGILSPILIGFASGTVLGVGAAYVSARLLENQLYGVTVADRTIFTLLPLAFVAIAILTSLVPAHGLARQRLADLLRAE